jgi:hypothetical protein
MIASQNIGNYWLNPSGPSNALENLPFHLGVLDIDLVKFFKHYVCLIFQIFDFLIDNYESEIIVCSLRDLSLFGIHKTVSSKS